MQPPLGVKAEAPKEPKLEAVPKPTQLLPIPELTRGTTHLFVINGDNREDRHIENVGRAVNALKKRRVKKPQ